MAILSFLFSLAPFRCLSTPSCHGVGQASPSRRHDPSFVRRRHLTRNFGPVYTYFNSAPAISRANVQTRSALCQQSCDCRRTTEPAQHLHQLGCRSEQPPTTLLAPRGQSRDSTFPGLDNFICCSSGPRADCTYPLFFFFALFCL